MDVEAEIYTELTLIQGSALDALRPFPASVRREAGYRLGKGAR